MYVFVCFFENFSQMHALAQIIRPKNRPAKTYSLSLCSLLLFWWFLCGFFFLQSVGRSVVHQKLHSCFSCLLFTLLVLNYVRLFQAWWLFSAHIKTHTKMIMESNATHTDPTKTTDFKVACVFWVVAAFLISDELPQRNPLFLRTITHTHT